MGSPRLFGVLVLIPKEPLAHFFHCHLHHHHHILQVNLTQTSAPIIIIPISATPTTGYLSPFSLLFALFATCERALCNLLRVESRRKAKLIYMYCCCSKLNWHGVGQNPSSLFAKQLFAAFFDYAEFGADLLQYYSTRSSRRQPAIIMTFIAWIGWSEAKREEKKNVVCPSPSPR